MQESGEMYLETILTLIRDNGNVRSIDIADAMNFSKPSVSRAVNKLKADGYITIDKSGYIALAPSGQEIAEKIYERHIVLTEFLTSLGVNKITAATDACRMEHVISDESFQALKGLITEYQKLKKK